MSDDTTYRHGPQTPHLDEKTLESLDKAFCKWVHAKARLQAGGGGTVNPTLDAYDAYRRRRSVVDPGWS